MRESIPLQPRLHERLTVARAWFFIILGRFAFFFVLVMFAYFADFLITGITLNNWISDRWFIPLGLLLLSCISLFVSGNKRYEEFEFIRSLGKSINPSVISSNSSNFAVGPIRIDRRPIEIIVVSPTPTGMLFWRRGKFDFAIRWEDILKIRLHSISTDSDSVEAELEIRRELGKNVTIHIPWSSKLTRLLPSMTLLKD